MKSNIVSGIIGLAIGATATAGLSHPVELGAAQTDQERIAAAVATLQEKYRAKYGEYLQLCVNRTPRSYEILYDLRSGLSSTTPRDI